MSKWTKRKLFTFQFKDRPRRALLWRKSVYEEWFEYAKLYQLEGGEIPEAFGDLGSFDNFEAWWRHPDYGFELFCEPELGQTVQPFQEALATTDQETINLSVRLDVDPDIVLRDFKKILKDCGRNIQYKSKARFKPSLPMKALKPEKLRQARLAFEFSQQAKREGLVQTEIILLLSKMDSLLPQIKSKREESQVRRHSPYHLAEFEQPIVDANGNVIVERSHEFINWQKKKLRLLSHHRRSTKKIFQSIKSGTFP